jgi:hypothetical protein
MLLHEVQRELTALENAHPPTSTTLLNLKKQEKITVQDWAIKVATENFNLVAAEDKEADVKRLKLSSEVHELSEKLRWNEYGDEMRTLDWLREEVPQAESAYKSVHVRFLDAESLLEQAKLTPKGELKSAEQDLRKAEDRYFAADMKLKALTSQQHPDPRIVRAAQKEFESAQAQQSGPRS